MKLEDEQQLKHIKLELRKIQNQITGNVISLENTELGGEYDIYSQIQDVIDNIDCIIEKKEAKE